MAVCRGGYAEGLRARGIYSVWNNRHDHILILAFHGRGLLFCIVEKAENILASDAIKFAMKIHSRFGPGLLESSYRECLAYELRRLGYSVDVEKSLPLVYEEVKLDHGYRMDLLVDDKLVIEIKSVDTLLDVHFAQVLTYLKVGNYRLGLLLNFKVAHLRDGVKRVANKL